MNYSDKEIFDASVKRIAQIFKIPADSIQLDYEIGEELKASFQSDWAYNEHDKILHDIQDVADRNIMKEIYASNMTIKTVRDYCNHMLRCYQTAPKEVIYTLKLNKQNN